MGKYQHCRLSLEMLPQLQTFDNIDSNKQTGQFLTNSSSCSLPRGTNTRRDQYSLIVACILCMPPYTFVEFPQNSLLSQFGSEFFYTSSHIIFLRIWLRCLPYKSLAQVIRVQIDVLSKVSSFRDPTFKTLLHFLSNQFLIKWS